MKECRGWAVKSDWVVGEEKRRQRGRRRMATRIPYLQKRGQRVRMVSFRADAIYTFKDNMRYA